MKHLRGYTLIEILIAIFIFAIVSGIVSLSISTTQRAFTHNQKALSELAKLQNALLIIERDITQVFNRNIVDENLKSQGRLTTGRSQELMFIRTGYVNPKEFYDRSQLQRIRYRLKDGELFRDAWTFDNLTDKPNASRVIAQHINKLRWTFYDKKLQTYTLWPPVSQLTEELPGVIVLTIEFENYGTVERTFLVPVYEQEYKEKSQ